MLCGMLAPMFQACFTVCLVCLKSHKTQHVCLHSSHKAEACHLDVTQQPHLEGPNLCAKVDNVVHSGLLG